MISPWTARLPRLTKSLFSLRQLSRGLLAGLTLAMLGTPTAADAQEYKFTTFSGLGTRAGLLDGAVGGQSVALFNSPFALALKGDGSLYVSDNGNSVIRLISPTGVVSTFVGTPGRSGVSNGTSSDPAILFSLPQGVVVDGNGNVYVADFAGHTIRKITSTGTTTTLAGTAGTAGSADGTGTAALFRNPSSLAVDSAGNVYVADSGNNLIRKVTSAGVVTVVAGSVGVTGSADGKGTAATFANPRGLVADSAGNLYVADSGNNVIRKITSAGDVTTIAGSAGQYGSADGTGSAARFSFPNAVAVDAAGNVYVADELNATIRKVTAGGVVTTLAGSPGVTGRANGTGAAARFDKPTGLVADAEGNVFVADYGNHLIRKVSPTGVVTTVAGAGGVAGLENGSGFLVIPALYRNPTNAVRDAAGNIYVTDAGNNSVRKISPSGVVTTLAGNGGAGSADGTGSAARFYSPSGIAIDQGGNLYIADTGNHVIRRVSPSGEVTTHAGVAGTRGSADGDRAAATFDLPSGVAVDNGGNIYVADFGNQVIRMIAPSGNVSTIAGSVGLVGSNDGVGGSARFTYPRDLAMDSSNNLYVADSGNHTIRRVSPGGLVTTLAGNAGTPGAADGSGSIARFNGPAGLSLDPAGNLFVADTGNNTIRRVTFAGVVTTVGGTAGKVGFADGTGTAALFNRPTDTLIDGSGNLFVVDNRNHTLRVGTLPGNPIPGDPTGSGNGSGTGNGNGDPGSNTGSDDTTGTGFLLQPVGLVADSSTGTYYVCDTANHCIKRILSDGTVTVFAGRSGSSGTADGTGDAARFNSPYGITLGNGELFVTDSGNSTIRKITSAGVVTTFAGTAGNSGTTDGTGAAALFGSPKGIVYRAASSELFVADSVNSNIRKITSAGVVTTFAGGKRVTGDADGVGDAARFNNPTGLAIFTSGTLMVADTFNNTIRSVVTADITDSDGKVLTPAATVATVAGTPGVSGIYDGVGEYALFNAPQGVAVEASTGFVYVADTGNNSIRRINGSRGVVTIAGVASVAGRRGGAGEQALFTQPQALYSFSTAGFTVADTGNSILRTVTLPAATGAYSAVVSTVKLTSGTTNPGGGDGGNGGGGGGGGGGAPSLWFIAAIALAGWARLRQHSR